MKKNPLSVSFTNIRKILQPVKFIKEIFVVGGGIEPPAHCVQTDALPMCGNTTQLSYRNQTLFKELEFEYRVSFITYKFQILYKYIKYF